MDPSLVTAISGVLVALITAGSSVLVAVLNTRARQDQPRPNPPSQSYRNGVEAVPALAPVGALRETRHARLSRLSVLLLSMGVTDVLVTFAMLQWDKAHMISLYSSPEAWVADHLLPIILSCLGLAAIATGVLLAAINFLRRKTPSRESGTPLAL
jgi:hypothetical protein